MWFCVVLDVFGFYGKHLAHRVRISGRISMLGWCRSPEICWTVGAASYPQKVCKNGTTQISKSNYFNSLARLFPLTVHDFSEFGFQLSPSHFKQSLPGIVFLFNVLTLGGCHCRILSKVYPMQHGSIFRASPGNLEKSLAGSISHNA